MFYDFIRLNNDLRDLDFKRNLEEKNNIYETAKNLLEEKSITKMHQLLQDLHERWKNVGPVKKELREPIWVKFQDITRKLNQKRNNYFVEKKKEDLIKLGIKKSICKKIDNLTSEEHKSHKDWEEATKRCNQLDSEWRKIGKLNTAENKIAWKQLKESLTKFYKSKNTFYKNRKKENKNIIEKKIKICEEAEKLQNSTNWRSSNNRLIQLQKDWKNSGFSPAKNSNEIWQKFNKACNVFFKAQKKYYKELDNKKQIALKQKLLLIKELESFKLTEHTEKNIKFLKGVSEKWSSTGDIPNESTGVNNKFQTLIDGKFEELGISKEKLLKEKYKNKIISIKDDEKAISNEKRVLNGKIDSLKKEITQYENNISFFGNGKETKPLIEQTKQKIKNTKAKIQEFRQKIQLLNRL